VAIPHGIDPTIYYPNPKEKERYKHKFDLTDQELVFTCLGTNIGPRKGFAETMEAYGNFLNKNPDAAKDTKLYMHTDYFGRDGGYNLYNLCQLYGISSNVKFTAMDTYEIMSDNDIADLYRASDVFFNCSHGEGFGKPILEASACGVPVVATDCTSMPELVKGHGVLIRPSGRLLQNLNYTYHYMPFVPDIAKAMETYYEDWKGGRKLLTEHGEAGAKMARENYSWDNLNNKWLDMLKEYEKENKK
jgi:glycosyltransferase involved in cell wall biosynthesis